METCPCKKVKCEYHGDCSGCRKHHETEETKWEPACDRLAKKAEAKRLKNLKKIEESKKERKI